MHAQAVESQCIGLAKVAAKRQQFLRIQGISSYHPTLHNSSDDSAGASMENVVCTSVIAVEASCLDSTCVPPSMLSVMLNILF